MARKNHSEDEVLRSLSRKGSVSINRREKTVNVTNNKGDLGNGSWGKISFLVKYCGYVLFNPTGSKALTGELG